MFPCKTYSISCELPFGARPILFGSHSMSVATVSSLLCMVEVVCPIIYLSLDKYRICRIVWRFISAQEENETKRETHRIINLFNYSYCIADIGIVCIITYNDNYTTYCQLLLTAHRRTVFPQRRYEEKWSWVDNKSRR